MASPVPVDLRERMEVLFWQETTSYKTVDYLSSFRKNLQQPDRAPTNIQATTKTAISFGIEDDIASSGDQIKEHWRDIICEWAYNCKFEEMNLRDASTTIRSNAYYPWPANFGLYPTLQW